MTANAISNVILNAVQSAMIIKAITFPKQPYQKSWLEVGNFHEDDLGHLTWEPTQERFPDNDRLLDGICSSEWVQNDDHLGGVHIEWEIDVPPDYPYWIIKVTAGRGVPNQTLYSPPDHTEASKYSDVPLTDIFLFLDVFSQCMGSFDKESNTITASEDLLGIWRNIEELIEQEQ